MADARAYTTVLDAYEDQVRQLPAELQLAECGLIEIGRRHAQDFDKGHEPSGGGVQRVLTELRKLHREWSSLLPAEQPRSELDIVRHKRNQRLSDPPDMQCPPMGDDCGT
jgi:hypothetical protein